MKASCSVNEFNLFDKNKQGLSVYDVILVNVSGISIESLILNIPLSRMNLKNSLSFSGELNVPTRLLLFSSPNYPLPPIPLRRC